VAVLAPREVAGDELEVDAQARRQALEHGGQAGAVALARGGETEGGARRRSVSRATERATDGEAAFGARTALADTIVAPWRGRKRQEGRRVGARGERRAAPPQARRGRRSRQRRAAGAVARGAATLVVFWPPPPSGFLLDDVVLFRRAPR
jgi:hypothetical protein